MECPIPSSQNLQLEARGLVSIFVTVTMLEEEVKEEQAKRWRGGRQHVNEPAQCHWAPHRTAIWRIKDSYHLAASPTLYPHRIRINQILVCHNTPWPLGGKKKSGKTAFKLKKKKSLSTFINTVKENRLQYTSFFLTNEKIELTLIRQAIIC